MSANLLQPEKIQIVDFKIIKGQINNPFEFNNKKIEGFSFDLDFDLGFNLNDKLVRAEFSVNVETKSHEDNKEEALGAFSFTYVFFVENIEDLTQVDENQTVIVNPALGNALASISYSTSRGILMTRFQGTALSNFVLPVINPNDLLK